MARTGTQSADITAETPFLVVRTMRDGRIDLFVANDTQPNKLYRNLRNGHFEDIAIRAGVAFSDDGRARAGMGVDQLDRRLAVAVVGMGLAGHDDLERILRGDGAQPVEVGE